MDGALALSRLYWQPLNQRSPTGSVRRVVGDEGTDRVLVQAALAGEATAMRALVDTLLPVVHARVGLVLARRRDKIKGRDLRAVVEDFVQELFVTLFEDGGRVLRSWNPARGLSLKGFVGLVAERQTGKTLKVGRRSPFTEDPAEPETMSRLEAGAAPGQRSLQAEEIETRNLLAATVARLRAELSEQGFALFEALFVEEQTVEQVCATMALSPDAVYAWRSRIARKARAIRDELLAERPGGPGRSREDQP
jgi:DNA-directed RNA polymerase specialized sigma24 family protein